MKKALLAALSWVKGLFTRNIGMKVGALVFAFLLWSFVLAEQNPPKEKIFGNVYVSYATSEALRAKGLTSAQPFSEILGTVAVTVEANANELSFITEEMITAEVALSAITEPGEYLLPVKASSLTPAGTIVRVNPSEVAVTIEAVVAREVPLEIRVEGEKNGALFYGEPVSDKTMIEVVGARSNVEQVAKAVCVIDVTDLTEATTEMYPVALYTSDDKIADNNLFTSVDSVIVELPVYPQKTVRVDVSTVLESIVGVAPGYEITNVTVLPEEVGIAGRQEQLDATDTVSLAPITLDNASADQIVQAAIVLPEGVYAAQPKEVQVTLTIAPQQVNNTYSAVDIAVKNLAEGLSYSLQPEAVDVTVSGTSAQMEEFSASLLHPVVDLEGLSIGVHTLELKFENEPDLGVTIKPSVTEIRVTIR